MRVLVIGASGFVGQYLIHRLSSRPDIALAGTFHSRIPPVQRMVNWYQADLTGYASLQQAFQESQPQVVVLLAAVADVGTVERDPEKATEINVLGTTHVAWLCRQYRARLIFLSSEYVFSHDRGNYRENDPTQPRFHYGRTKQAAEQVIPNTLSQWSIVRTSLVYGWPLPGRRNLATVVRERLESGETFPGHSNVYRTPIYVEHLTEGIARLVLEHRPGVLHIAGGEWTTMYHFATAVASAFQLDERLVVPTIARTGLSAPNPPKGGISNAETPDLLGLDCARTMQRLGLRTYSLAEGLQEMRARQLDFQRGIPTALSDLW